MYHYKQSSYEAISLSIGKYRKVDGALLIFQVYS